MSSYTQFYALYAGTVLPDLTAVWNGSWNLTGTDNGPFLTDGAKYGSANTNKTKAETSATNPYDVSIERFATRKLLPQTITGTLDIVLGIKELSTGGDQYTRLYAYVYNATDDSILGVALDWAESAGGGGTEWTTTQTGTGLQAAQTLTDVIVPSDGKDYHLVIEFGYRAFNASSGTHNGQLRVGAQSSALVPLSDLTVGSTSVTTLAGYFLFSNAVSVETDNDDTFFIAGTMLIPGADFSLNGAPEVATILNVSTGVVVGRWAALPTAETGCNLPSGIWAITAQATPGSSVVQVRVYDDENQLLSAVAVSSLAAGTWGAFSPLSSDRANTFYVLRISSASPTTLHSISDAGVAVDSWTMPSSAGRGCSALAIARDGSKAYFGFRNSDEAATGIGRFDLAGAGTELTELIPTSAGLTIGRDLICTLEGDVLCAVFTGASSSEIRRYADDGTLLATYPLPDGSFIGDTLELSQNPVDETTFYVRSYPSTSTSHIYQIRISDGEVLNDYPLTTNDGVTTFIPTSCPFIIFPAEPDEGDGLIGPLAWVHWPRVIPA